MRDVTLAPERWLPVPGYEGLYEVSDLGHARSLIASKRWGAQPVHILKPTMTTVGRLAVTLVQGNEQRRTKTWYIHTLVAAAFLGPRPAGQEVRHLDGDPWNNFLSNLAYGTRSENRQDSVRHGTHRNTRKIRCPQGHKYTPENTYQRPGGKERQCRICMEAENVVVNQNVKRENDELRTVAARHKESWTEAEIAVVQSNPELPSAQLAVMLGRTRCSVDYVRYRVLKKRGVEAKA